MVGAIGARNREADADLMVRALRVLAELRTMEEFIAQAASRLP
jgi:hypothetical protein